MMIWIVFVTINYKPGVKMYDNYEKILNRVRGIVKQTVAESNQAEVLAELNDLELSLIHISEPTRPY